MRKFVYNADDKTMRFAQDLSRCVSVASQTVPAGSWVKRPL